MTNEEYITELKMLYEIARANKEVGIALLLLDRLRDEQCAQEQREEYKKTHPGD